MSYNGSGTFNINTAGQPVVTGTVISSTAFNALTADLGTGLSTAITKDGQTVTTLLIPFAAGISVGSPGITGPAGNTTTLAVHTRQVFLTGTAATYTRPANCTQIVVRAKGGGGGGGGTGTSAPTDATSGGTTSFNSINANGGTLGAANNTAGPGGTGGTGTASVRIAGAIGGGVTNIFSSATNSKYVGGNGGGAGGGLGGNGAGNGSASVANSGGGGGAGGVPSTAWASLQNWFSAGGGGEGEYIEILINSPAATYTYTVGAGGTAGVAGTGGQNGGAGGSGYIIVDEYY